MERSHGCSPPSLLRNQSLGDALGVAAAKVAAAEVDHDPVRGSAGGVR